MCTRRSSVFAHSGDEASVLAVHTVLSSSRLCIDVFISRFIAEIQPPCNRSGACPQLISTTLNFSTDGDSERSLPTCLPPQFQPLFNFMEGIASIYDGNFMRNGAGKLLTYELLSLTGIGLCKISTTRDPRTDWCGYPESTTKPLGKLYGEMILLLDHSKSIDSFLHPLQFRLPAFLGAYLFASTS